MTETPSDRLKKAREAKGYAGPTEAARAHSWPVSTYTSHENGTRGFKYDEAKKYGRAYGVSALWLLALSSEATTITEVDVMGEAAIGVWREGRATRAGGAKGKKQHSRTRSA